MTADEMSICLQVFEMNWFQEEACIIKWILVILYNELVLVVRELVKPFFRES